MAAVVSDLTAAAKKRAAANGRRIAASGARVITYDIECAPARLIGFGLRDQNFGLNQIEEPSYVLGIGYKVLGDKEVVWIDRRMGAEAMLRQAHAVFGTADALNGYNNCSFDQRVLNWELAKLGLGPFAPARHIDLYRAVRRNFRPLSGKLDFIAQELGLGAKIQTGGMELWHGCMEGDSRAWAKMARYCRQDVALTEQLYLHMLPWLPTNAHMGLVVGDGDGCPNCASRRLAVSRTGRTQTTAYQVRQCRDCLTWVRTGKPFARATTRVAA